MRSEFAGRANQQPKSAVKGKKTAHKPLRISWISQCLPCLIFVQSCYFGYNINLSNVLAALSAFLALLTWTRPTTRAKEHGHFYLDYPQINEVGKIRSHVSINKALQSFKNFARRHLPRNSQQFLRNWMAYSYRIRTNYSKKSTTKSVFFFVTFNFS